MTRHRIGIVEAIAMALIAINLVATVVGALALVWHSWGYFHILGMAAIVLALGAFAVLAIRCMMGENLIPFLVVAIFASAPGFFVARSVEVPAELHEPAEVVVRQPLDGQPGRRFGLVEQRGLVAGHQPR